MSKYGSSGLLPTIIYPSTAKAAADELLADVEATNTSVVACPGLSPTMASNWATFYTTVKTFLQQEPSIWGLGSRMDRIASYADDLYEWKKQIQQTTCTLSVPVVDPQTVPPETSSLINLAHWGTYAVIAVAVAYGIGKAVEVLPKGAASSAAPARPSLGARVRGHASRAKAALHRATA